MKKIIMSGGIGTDILASDIRQQLEDARDDHVVLEVNSPGGSFFAGLEIFNILKDYRGKTTAKIIGLAASAASYICMAADEVLTFENSVFMIHNASGVTVGDYRAHKKSGEVLEKLSDIMSKTYAKKTGKGSAEIHQMMDEETWLYGKEISDSGFADKHEGAGTSEGKTAAEAKDYFSEYRAKLAVDASQLSQIAAAIGTSTQYNPLLEAARENKRRRDQLKEDEAIKATVAKLSKCF